MSSWLGSVVTGLTSRASSAICMSCPKPATRMDADCFHWCETCGPLPLSGVRSEFPDSGTVHPQVAQGEGRTSDRTEQLGIAVKDLGTYRGQCELGLRVGRLLGGC